MTTGSIIPQKFKIDYEKRKNTDLFTTFQSQELTFLSEIQNYIPIYDRFFSLNETNYNSINLNHKWYITDIKEKIDDCDNLFRCNIKNAENTTAKTKKKDVFFKMAPLLDPFKFLIGKYDVTDPTLIALPKQQQQKEQEQKINPKILEHNNSAYVDGFFSFLTSILIHKHGFVHGVDYYGSFLAIKNDFKLNIFDDLDYLCKSDFFNKNKNIAFKVDEYEHLLDKDRSENDDNSIGGKLKSRIPLKIEDGVHSLSIKSINDDIYENLFEESGKSEDAEEHITLDDLSDIMDTVKCNTRSHARSLDSGSTCSSRTSHTSDSSTPQNNCSNCDELGLDEIIELSDDKKEETGEGEMGEVEVEGSGIEEGGNKEDDTDWTDESSSNGSTNTSDYEEQRIDATLPKFPVQVICMEYCENTFDSLIMEEDLSQEEWLSAFMQIIMILITYQKAFSFTHNDLHTNNVMYSSTDKKCVYYCYKNKYYKVPTFGRLYKIIDFGRGIYKFDGKLFCSDSFQMGEDASTQYNTEPYMNNKKPRLDPNYSFDLCRLACSIFDYMVDDLDEIADLDKCEPATRLIVDWCLDDNGINVLYKTNGSERYPDFKLYKMIARCVHNHIPQAQLIRPEFDAFSISKSTVPKNEMVMNIDEMPCLA